MKNQNPNQSQNKPIKTYDAGDLEDAHALAFEHLKWIGALTSTILENTKNNKHWHNRELLEITQYLAESFTNDHDLAQEKYRAEQGGSL